MKHLINSFASLGIMALFTIAATAINLREFHIAFISASVFWISYFHLKNQKQ